MPPLGANSGLDVRDLSVISCERKVSRKTKRTADVAHSLAWDPGYNIEVYEGSRCPDVRRLCLNLMPLIGTTGRVVLLDTVTFSIPEGSG